MSFLLSLFLPFLACIGLSTITSALWWSTLRSPWSFTLFGLLALLGLHRVVQVVAEFAKLFSGGGYFLEVRKNQDPVQLAMESVTLESLAICVVVVTIGIPMLIWLKRLFLAI